MRLLGVDIERQMMLYIITVSLIYQSFFRSPQVGLGGDEGQPQGLTLQPDRKGDGAICG